MNTAAIFKNRTVRLIAVILCVLLFVGFFLFIGLQLRSQQKKLAELNAEKVELKAKLDELQREQERLQSRTEYVKSLEGLLQYARDYLGYIGPGDTRIEDGE